MNRRPVYIVLAGLPASGKSTLRATLTQAWDVNAHRHAFGSPDILYSLSTDDMIDWIAADRGLTYSDVFSNEIKNATECVKVKRRILVDRLCNIIHDQTNTTYKKRRSLIDDLPADYLKVCVPVHVACGMRRERLTSRPGKVIPAHIDNDMVNSWQHPDICEGFDVVVPPYLVQTALRPYFV